MAIKRFDVKTCMLEERKGKYVHYEDVPKIPVDCNQCPTGPTCLSSRNSDICIVRIWRHYEKLTA
jgi:hypothetical protein